MKKNLVPIGNSLGIIIDKPYVEMLGLNKKSQVIMVSDGKHLIIKPINNGATASKLKSAKTAKQKISSSKAKPKDSSRKKASAKPKVVVRTVKKTKSKSPRKSTK